MSPSTAVPAAPSPVVPPPEASREVADPLFTLLFDASPLLVGVVEWLGDDARYLAVNPATAGRLGQPVTAIRGRRARELGLPAEACAAWGRLAAEASRRGGAVRAEWGASGERGRHTFRTTVVPLPTPPGRAPRFAYLTEDLTRVRRLEGRLEATDSRSGVLGQDVEEPLGRALHALDVVADELDTVVDLQPDLELGDVAATLRDGIGATRRAHRRLRDLIWG
ncbi:MAG TPA: PAS domain-containing protein [Myxococcaceae bacterium]|nr:PAS domain-containing protein [Myxococcaceae bacterium]